MQQLLPRFAAACLLLASATAQTPGPRAMPVRTPIADGGTLHLATGVWTEAPERPGARFAAGKTAGAALANVVPPRPPGFCTGCPERPVFTAMKLVQRELGDFHVSCDIGCHLFSILPPFNIGNTVLGYGLGLASSTGVGPNFDKRVVSMMGDGGFWHNGLTSGVANAVFQGDDGVLVIMNNGYSAATGHQAIPSSVKGGEVQLCTWAPTSHTPAWASSRRMPAAVSSFATG